MKNLGSRIKYMREKLGLSQGQVADKLGVSQQAIQQVETGKAKKPKYLYEMAVMLGVSYEWLVLGEENPKFAQGATRASNNNAVQEAATPNNADTMIKIVELIQGGPNGYHLVTGALADTLPRPRRLDGVDRTYGIYVYDNKMAPRFHTGDLVYVHPKMPYAEDDYTLVHIKGEPGKPIEIACLCFDNKDENTYVFKQLNPYKVIRLEANQVQAVHKIVAVEQY
jgi:transcriptional regulator with XRE-family HTH domain